MIVNENMMLHRVIRTYLQEEQGEQEHSTTYGTKLNLIIQKWNIV